MDFLKWPQAVIKMLFMFISLNPVTVGTQNLIYLFGILRKVSNKLIPVINIPKLDAPFPSVDMVHLQSPSIRKTTMNTLISKKIKYEISLVFSYTSSVFSHVRQFAVYKAVPLIVGHSFSFIFLVIKSHIFSPISLGFNHGLIIPQHG